MKIFFCSSSMIPAGPLVGFVVMMGATAVKFTSASGSWMKGKKNCKKLQYSPAIQSRFHILSGFLGLFFFLQKWFLICHFTWQTTQNNSVDQSTNFAQHRCDNTSTTPLFATVPFSSLSATRLWGSGRPPSKQTRRLTAAAHGAG